MIDARPKTGTAPDEYPELRLKSAHQSLITDVSRLRPHPCTIIAAENSDANRRWRHTLPKTLDEGHQSVTRQISSSHGGWYTAQLIIIPNGKRSLSKRS
jgi:hypothetical protein